MLFVSSVLKYFWGMINVL
jgi:hypothetical protein